MKKKKQLHLKKVERKQLQELIHKGREGARKLYRSRILLLLDDGETMEQISRILDISIPTVCAVKKRYIREGLNVSLEDRPRGGRPSIFDGKKQARITALACSTPPEGRCRWTLRLLADKAVELKLVNDISYVSIQRMLKKTNLSLT